MFTVIEIVDNKKRGLQKLLTRFSHTPPELIKIAVKYGAPYFKIRVINERNLPWDEILFMAGRCASNVIVDKKILLPDDRNVHRFEPKILPMRILFNTVYDLFKIMNVNKAGIGIIDTDAVCCDFTGLFADFSSLLTVYTQHPQKYEKICSDIFDETGLSIIVSDNFDSVSGCEYTISKYPIDHSVNFSLYGDADGQTQAHGINIPPVYGQKIPDGIDELLFASALYELSGVKRLKNLRFSNIVLNGKICSIDEIMNSIKFLFN